MSVRYSWDILFFYFYFTDSISIYLYTSYVYFCLICKTYFLGLLISQNQPLYLNLFSFKNTTQPITPHPVPSHMYSSKRSPPFSTPSSCMDIMRAKFRTGIFKTVFHRLIPLHPFPTPHFSLHLTAFCHSLLLNFADVPDVDLQVHFLSQIFITFLHPVIGIACAFSNSDSSCHFIVIHYALIYQSRKISVTIFKCLFHPNPVPGDPRD